MTDETPTRERAKPMTPDDRRTAILDAVIPLLVQHGRAVSTRQMAAAAGIAEGTIFRAFTDKEAVFAAAVERFFDPEPFVNAVRGIDANAPTVDKVHQLVRLIRERFTGARGFMSMMQLQGPPASVHRHPGRGARELGTHHRDDAEWYGVLAQIFAPGELRVSTQLLGYFIRMVAFASSVSLFNGPHEFTVDELVDLISHGVLPADAQADSTPPLTETEA